VTYELDTPLSGGERITLLGQFMGRVDGPGGGSGAGVGASNHDPLSLRLMRSGIPNPGAYQRHNRRRERVTRPPTPAPLPPPVPPPR